MNHQDVYVTITAEDEVVGTTLARLLEQSMREAGVPGLVQLARKAQDRAVGVQPSERGRLRDMLAKVKVSLALVVR